MLQKAKKNIVVSVQFLLKLIWRDVNSALWSFWRLEFVVLLNRIALQWEVFLIFCQTYLYQWGVPNKLATECILALSLVAVFLWGKVKGGVLGQSFSFFVFIHPFLRPPGPFPEKATIRVPTSFHHHSHLLSNTRGYWLHAVKKNQLWCVLHSSITYIRYMVIWEWLRTNTKHFNSKAFKVFV